MRRLATTVFAALALAISVFAAAGPPPMRGVVLTLTMEDAEFSYVPFVEEVRDLGATHLSLLIAWYQRDVQATAIHAKPGKTVPEQRLRETIRAARGRGLEVMLLPIVLLEEEGEDDWRGSLAPSDPDAWFDVYTTRLLALAELAKEEQVALLSVGSEFASLERDETRWRRLCKAVRGVFPGQLVYTANWDTPDRVAWWDAVDHMGISAYYELAVPGDATTTGTLTQEWAAWRQWLLEKRDLHAPGKPILFSEVGYPSIEGGAALPWDYTREAPASPAEQRDAFEALIRTWESDPSLSGVFVYTWMDFGEAPERGYSPRGKPAEELLRAWFRSGENP